MTQLGPNEPNQTTLNDMRLIGNRRLSHSKNVIPVIKSKSWLTNNLIYSKFNYCKKTTATRNPKSWLTIIFPEMTVRNLLLNYNQRTPSRMERALYEVVRNNQFFFPVQAFDTLQAATPVFINFSATPSIHNPGPLPPQTSEDHNFIQIRRP